MRASTPAAVLVAAALLAARSADAADDPTSALRADVDALVKMMNDRWNGRDDEGPSPTSRVNHLIAAGDAKLKPVLAEAWNVVTTWSAARQYKNSTRQLVRFLYSLTETGKAAAAGDEEIVEEDGVVRIRNGDPAGGFAWRGWDGGGFGRRTDESAPPFAELVKGGKLRKPSRPDVKKTLAALDGGKVPDAERFAVAKCVGEACAANKPAMQDLLRRFDSDPASQWLMTALAWSGAAEAERPLLIEIETLAGRAAEGKGAAAEILATACRALLRLRRGAVVDEAAKLPDAQREALLAAAGADFATALDLAAIEKAPDPAAKNAALANVCRRLVASRGDSRTCAATVTSLAKLLASSVDAADGELRTSILDAADTLLYAYNRWPVNEETPLGDAGRSHKRTGDRVGPYPDMATLLAFVGADLAKGDLVFVDSEATSIFDLTGGDRPAHGWKRLRSDVRWPDFSSADAPSAADQFPAKIEGAMTPAGLRLTLTNQCAAPISINPVALRYATAEITKDELHGGGARDVSYRQLSLQLGFIRAGAATPAGRLVVLAPKEPYSWTIAVRPEHRDVDHVSVELSDWFAVKGKPAAPPLSGFETTWVK